MSNCAKRIFQRASSLKLPCSFDSPIWFQLWRWQTASGPRHNYWVPTCRAGPLSSGRVPAARQQPDPPADIMTAKTGFCWPQLRRKLNTYRTVTCSVWSDFYETCFGRVMKEPNNPVTRTMKRTMKLSAMEKSGEIAYPSIFYVWFGLSQNRYDQTVRGH